MELVGVGRGREVAPLPLPPFAPVGVPVPMAGSCTVDGASPVGAADSLAKVEHVSADSDDPVGVELEALAHESRAVTAAEARFDARLAAAYLWGAAELAVRCGDPDPRRRREWGARGMLAELAATLHQAEGALARRLTRITMLAAFPRLAGAHAAGVVSAAHVGVVLDVFHAVTDPDVLLDADAALVERACELTAPQLRAAARRWRARHVPATQEQHARAVADRFVAVSPADDDLCWLTALLPAPAAFGLMHRIDELAATVAGPDEPRTLPQLRADVLCDLLLNPGADPTPGAAGDVRAAEERGADQHGGAGEGRSADQGRNEERVRGPNREHDPNRVRDREHDASGAQLGDATSATGESPDGRGPCDGRVLDPAGPECGHGGPGAPDGGVPGWVRHVVPHVVLTVPVLSLLGHGHHPAELDGFGPIDLDTARALCANAPSFTRVLTHPETGAVLSVGRRQYTIPTDLRRAVNLRDGTCRFPGCRRRAARCDIDHTTAWADGGPTSLDNLATVCAKHHQLKHRAGWTSTLHPDGTLLWRSPTGRRYTTQPAVALPVTTLPSTAPPSTAPPATAPPSTAPPAPGLPSTALPSTALWPPPPTRPWTPTRAPAPTRTPIPGRPPAPDDAGAPARPGTPSGPRTRTTATTDGYPDAPPF